MKNNILEKLLVSFVSIVVVIVAVLALIGSSKDIAYGAVTNTSIARLATSTTVTVGPATSTALFIDKKMCVNRVVSTKAQAVMLGFGATSTASRGLWQAASTTTSYPAELFGCGNVNAFGLVASTTIDILEFVF